jgi:predicted esterase
MINRKFIERKALVRSEIISNDISSPKQCILLLHGYGEKGSKIFKILKDHLPQDALILAPTGYYPIAEKLESRFRVGYAWYFFDTFTKEYLIDQTGPAEFLSQYINELKIEHLPLTIIGFSQGGYLAHFVAQHLKQTQKVIGIGCGFRKDLLQSKLDFKIYQIHGAVDSKVDIINAKNLFETILPQTKGGEFIQVADTDHEINRAVIQEVSRILNEDLI